MMSMNRSLISLIAFITVFQIAVSQTANSSVTLRNSLLNDSVTFTVAKDGSGNFTSIQAAINAVPDYRKKRTVILIKNGTYVEKIIVPESKQLLTIIGEDAEKTIISYGDWAQKKTILGEDTGTSGSATFYVFAKDFCAVNITFKNSAGPIGQAVAAHVSADRSVFFHCRFLGFQDTLYTYAENSRQYYKNCYIEGTTDFIFGWSTAVFDQCEIHSLADSYITAASTSQNSEFGYLFYRCKLTAAPTVTKVYLGRPWRIYAKTVFRECELGNHILPEGWHNWGKAEAEKTSFYAEYLNSGSGAGTSQRVKWAHQLDKIQAERWTVEHVLKGDDGWNPQLNGINQTIKSK